LVRGTFFAYPADHVRIATVHALVGKSIRSGQRAAKGRSIAPTTAITTGLFAVPLFEHNDDAMMPAGSMLMTPSTLRPDLERR